MRTSFITSLAAVLAAPRLGLAAPAASQAAQMFAQSELQLIAPSNAFWKMAPNSTAAPRLNSNTTTCGAFQSVNVNTTMFRAVSAVFAVPKVSSRPRFDWQKSPAVTPRIVVSAGIDGIDCPGTVRAGVYATVQQNGTQQHLPFVEFGGSVYSVRIAGVAAGEVVRVRVTVTDDYTANIDWANLNRTDQVFNKNVEADELCGNTVSWFVEDVVPRKFFPGDFFAAFEPVHFSLLEGVFADSSTVHFDSTSANFTTEQSLCKVDAIGGGLTVSSL